MDDGFKIKIDNLRTINGCLASKKTKAARRRYSQEHDEDMLLDGVDPFLIDTELKIAPSKAVRRMLDKTQVMTNPRNRHIRRRITHCGEVTSIAAFICAILGLNVELAKAIALGHDIGHPPFGHDGEKFLKNVSGQEFSHEVMGAIISQHIERGGHGLNLTHEVLRGFIRDSRTDAECGGVLSEEAKVVAFSDRFAYVTGDYSDIKRTGYEMPAELQRQMETLGSSQRERVNELVYALCIESAASGTVKFSVSHTARTFQHIKDLMYGIYAILNASNSVTVLERIYGFLQKLAPSLGVDPVLLLALMTDQDVLFLANLPVLDYAAFQQVTVSELVPSLRGKEIKWWDADLNW